MAVSLDWTPNPGPQTGFLACPIREILYGGAKGGGKSEAIGPLAVKHVTQYGEHATVLILRETMPQLRDLMRRVRPHCLRAGAKYNKTEKTWAFPGGGHVIFGHLSDGVDPYWGQEYTLVVIDEITRSIATEADYLELLGSLRSSRGVPCRVVLTSNPGGQGHNWVRTRFMSVPPLTVQQDGNGLARVFIPASLADNPHLPPEYRAQLEQLPEAERRAFLEGDWNAFEGAVFRLAPGVHTWTWAQFKERTGHDRPPLEWTRYRTLDWGYSHPFALIWFAVDYEGRAYAYREWYGVAKDSKGGFVPNDGARLLPEHVARKVADIEAAAGETGKVQGFSGPDLWGKVRGDFGVQGPKHAEVFATTGVHFTAWDDSRVQGKAAVHARLHHEEGEWPGLILIVDPSDPSTCHHGARTLPALEYDDHRVEDVDSDGEDHWYDSLRGFCMARPWRPVKPKKPDGWRERQAAAGSDWMTS